MAVDKSIAYCMTAAIDIILVWVLMDHGYELVEFDKVFVILTVCCHTFLYFGLSFDLTVVIDAMHVMLWLSIVVGCWLTDITLLYTAFAVVVAIQVQWVLNGGKCCLNETVRGGVLSTLVGLGVIAFTIVYSFLVCQQC